MIYLKNFTFQRKNGNGNPFYEFAINLDKFSLASGVQYCGQPDGVNRCHF